MREEMNPEEWETINGRTRIYSCGKIDAYKVVDIDSAFHSHSCKCRTHLTFIKVSELRSGQFGRRGGVRSALRLDFFFVKFILTQSTL
jgi:hypothetical protein